MDFPISHFCNHFANSNKQNMEVNGSSSSTVSPEISHRFPLVAISPGFGGLRPDRWRNAVLLTEVHVHRNSPTLTWGTQQAINRGELRGLRNSKFGGNPYKNQGGVK